MIRTSGLFRLTDSAGRFHVGGLSPGAITLRVQFPDAQTAERHLLLRGDQSTTLAIAMMTRPIPQSGLRAVVPGRAPSTPVSRLLKRLEAPRGQIVGHDEIARYHGTLSSLVGARNIYGPGTRMRRRAGFQLDRSTWCEPEFFVDGSPEAWIREEVVRRDRSDPLGGFAGLFGKDEVSTIEIYPPTDVPTDLDTETSEQCGAIVLWLKSYLGGR